MLYIAGTGTRQIQLMTAEEKNKVIDVILDQLQVWQLHNEAFGDGEGITVISGMAEGFDSALAAAAIRGGYRLWCFVPNRGYGNYYWGRKSLTRTNRERQFNKILAQAEHVEYTNEVLGVNGLYHNGLHMNFHRNQHMVDRADVLFGWVNSNGTADGGTADCVRRWNAKMAQVEDKRLVAIKALYETK